MCYVITLGNLGFLPDEYIECESVREVNEVVRDLVAERRADGFRVESSQRLKRLNQGHTMTAALLTSNAAAIRIQVAHVQ